MSFLGFLKPLNLALVLAVFLLSAYFLNKIYLKNSEIKELKNSLLEAKFELFKCDKSLERQNEAIKKLEIKGEVKEPLEVQKIRKVFIKDRSCEGELNAYKKLFDTAN